MWTKGVKNLEDFEERAKETVRKQKMFRYGERGRWKDNSKEEMKEKKMEKRIEGNKE